MLGHPLRDLLYDGIVLERCPLQHADLLIKVNEIGLIQLILGVLLQVVVSFETIQELAQLRIHLALLQNILGNLLPLLGLSYPLIHGLAELHQVVDHVLRNLDGPLRVAERFLVPVELAQKRAHLHVYFALVLQPLQLARRVRPVDPLNVRRADLRKAGVQAETALLEGAHLLEAKCHVVHGALNQEAVHGIPLKHQPIQQSLRLLQQAQGSIVLLLRDEVDGRVVELVED